MVYTNHLCIFVPEYYLMRQYLTLLLFCITSFCFSQNKEVIKKSGNEATTDKVIPQIKKASIDQYRIITLERDTTYVDTSLTIKSEYKFNYLRKDIFGLMPFANEGQTYNTLQFSLNEFSSYPEFGYKAKHFNYMTPNDIHYYSVATPITDLYFKSVMEQGQTLDAFITVNTSERLNFSLAYKGLRSLGKYINQLSSTGNFRFTTSYNTINKRYYANFHFVGQDILNGENGGITNPNDFEDEGSEFKNRARLEVYFKDAQSFLKGKRLFLDHSFRINPKDAQNNLYLTHQFNYEYQYFEYSQPTVASTITASDGTTSTLIRFGEAYVSSNIHDQNRYNRMYNKVGAVYENKTLGKFQFFAEDFRYNYYFNKILILETETIPGSLSDEINNIGGQYEYLKNKWKGKFIYSNSISDVPMSNLDANLEYKVNDKNKLSFRYQNINKIPDHIYNLHQSSYVAYNWFHDFNNEKINAISVNADTQWASASLSVQTLNDYLYFSDHGTNGQQLVTPDQYSKTIKYLSLKIGREFHFWKLALDNTLLYQKVDQEDDILNVPQFVTRNTLYFSDYFFKKKPLYIQTGITFNYFTKYYANEYNPVIGEFFVQNQKEIGNFPMLDFFVNARVRQTRFYLKAEHFNSAMTGNDYYSSPGYPYRDFMVRFGLVWTFFQ